MNTYAIVLNNCSFLVNCNNNYDANKIADVIEKLCDKNILADEPCEIVNLTQGTRYDGLYHEHHTDMDGFVPFTKIVDDTNDEISNHNPLKNPESPVYLQHPIFPTINSCGIDLQSTEKHLKINCPVCKRPETRGRYTPYLKNK